MIIKAVEESVYLGKVNTTLSHNGLQETGAV